MKKIVLAGLAILGVSAFVMAQEPVGKKKAEPKKEQEETKKTPQDKVNHAEQKSNGKAFSGKGNGPAKTKEKQVVKAKTKPASKAKPAPATKAPAQ